MKKVFFYPLVALVMIFAACQQEPLLDEHTQESQEIGISQFEQKALKQAIANGDIELSQESQANDATIQDAQTRAHGRPDDSGLRNLQSWMARLDSDMLLSKLSIPGTHNSGATKWGACQEMSIPQQLQAGVRALDIRCRHVNDALFIHHGKFYQDLTFGNVLEDCEAFLKANPTETIIMFVKEEHTAAENTRNFNRTIRDLYLIPYGSLFYRANKIPKLGEVRGKIVLITRYATTDGILTSWKDNATFLSDRGVKLHIQDKYFVRDAYSMDWKWAQCKDYLLKASNYDDTDFYINFLSGTGNLLLPESLAEGFMGYWGMNYQLHRWLITHPQIKLRTGVLMMDFIDKYLAGKVALTNYIRYYVNGTSSQETVGDGPNNGRAQNAVDDNFSTFWHTKWYGGEPTNAIPAFINIMLDKTRTISAINFKHRPNVLSGRPKAFYVEYYDYNTRSLQKIIQNRSLDPNSNNWVVYRFPYPVTSDIFRVTFTATVDNRNHTFMSEIQLVD